jgi:hypothetical protein
MMVKVPAGGKVSHDSATEGRGLGGGVLLLGGGTEVVNSTVKHTGIASGKPR